jgi:hypothetical protein
MFIDWTTNVHPRSREMSNRGRGRVAGQDADTGPGQRGGGAQPIVTYKWSSRGKWNQNNRDVVEATGVDSELDEVGGGVERALERGGHRHGG